MGAAAPLSHCVIAHDCALVHDQTRDRAKRPKAKKSYQKCARDYGNPCAELDEKGLVGGGPGKKKDISCCMKKEKL